MNGFTRGIKLALAVALFGGAALVRADAGVIKGKVIYTGDPVKRTKINTSKDPNCGKKIGSYDKIINKKTDPQTVRNVMVFVKSGLPDKEFTVPGEPVIITQVGCEYKPHVLGLMEGQTLRITNGDDTNHNIHFLPKVNEEINFSQPKKGMEKDVTLVKEDTMFKVKCDVHPWMAAYIGVFDHPFFAVTGKDGTFELKGLPAGTYTVEAWHETFKPQTMEITVAVDETVEKDFTFDGK
ncbi:MAG: carboxypeptidase regulatory-like domain-containing protein [Planctomycetota bacterium]|jgi:plastocyanin